jgi:uncharacterized protein YndB with AHSA1/START domain
MTVRRFAAGLSLCVLAAASARAAVAEADASHFVLNYTLPIAATPARAYAATVDIAHWWSSDHTYSGDAKNLRIESKPGGCFCEKLAGGGVEHMRVVLAMPGKLLRLSGGLGPLQAGAVSGTLTFTYRSGKDGNAIAVSYAVAGHVDGGLDKIAAGVDQVLGAQLQHLQRRADGAGSAAGAKP